MPTCKLARSVALGFMLALGACGEADQSPQEELDEALSVRTSAVGLADEVVFGDVVGNYGHYFHVFSGRSIELPTASWNDCPAGYTLVNRHFDSNGFWLCARNDLAWRTFYVGDVEANYGHHYRVDLFRVESLGSESWDVCPPATTLVGHWFHANGFWVCIGSWGGGTGGGALPGGGSPDGGVGAGAT